MDPVVLHNFLVDLRQVVGAELDEALPKLESVLANAVGYAVRNQPTLRDQFAMAALQGLLSFPYFEGQQWAPSAHQDPAQVAREVYALADAMLAEREPKAVTR